MSSDNPPKCLEPGCRSSLSWNRSGGEWTSEARDNAVAIRCLDCGSVLCPFHAEQHFAAERRDLKERADKAEASIVRIHASINGRAPHDRMDQCVEEWIADAKETIADYETEVEGLKAHCTVHNDSVHGAEAEQLRSRLEKLIHENQDFEDEGLGASEIRRILDDVDACDSLAFLEQAKAKNEELDRLRSRVRELENSMAAECNRHWHAGFSAATGEDLE